MDFVASGAAMFEFQAGFVFWEAWTSMHMIVLVIRIYVGSDAIQDYVEGNARVLKGWETGTGNVSFGLTECQSPIIDYFSLSMCRISGSSLSWTCYF